MSLGMYSEAPGLGDACNGVHLAVNHLLFILVTPALAAGHASSSSTRSTEGQFVVCARKIES